MMQDYPLLISGMAEIASNNHADTEIVTKLPESGEIHRYTYSDFGKRIRVLGKSLLNTYNYPQGTVIATLAWNTYRHLELYHTISSLGYVLHTVNPRLFPEQLVYIFNHAESKILFFDVTFIALIEKLRPQLKFIQHFVLLTDRSHMPLSPKPSFTSSLICYEDFFANPSDTLENWPIFPELTPAALCYTSGTTGNPKGVLYNHRSTSIHTLASIGPDVFNLSSSTTILPVVPFFHANAWGIPYTAVIAGSKLVLPGPFLDGKSLCHLITSENVNSTAAVPTVFTALFQYVESEAFKSNNNNKRLGIKKVLIGGSAVPRSLFEKARQHFGDDCEFTQAWGMTETSPLGCVSYLHSKHKHLPFTEQLSYRIKQGRPFFGIQIRIVSDDGKLCKRNGKDTGNIQVRGPWVVKQYFKEPNVAVDKEGWFTTGDIGTIDRDGILTITDRSKDVIKSGGEWVSSIDLENAVMTDKRVRQAAAIGVKHEKWEERPLLLVVREEGVEGGKELGREEVLKYLEGKVAKWWIPEDVVFVEELPLGATGKVDKKVIRDRMKDYKWPSSTQKQTQPQQQQQKNTAKL
eukprot:TRINITY_DN2576_c0_g1_i1.p1 TRINITY_DN2576_c0_g1~~TRINITY_DN2576_c0_g1_i1.p1  ORF type:complete len:576 (-),score=136.20 TRINITY_DN2576_c0_g1_i1:137-1864(-)